MTPQPQQQEMIWICRNDYEDLLLLLSSKNINKGIIERCYDILDTRTRHAPAAPDPLCICQITAEQCHKITEEIKAEVRNQALDEVIEKFNEVKAGIDAYEKEHEHQQCRDDCLGIYIPSNVVRRLIDIRIKSLRTQEHEAPPK